MTMKQRGIVLEQIALLKSIGAEAIVQKLENVIDMDDIQNSDGDDDITIDNCDVHYEHFINGHIDCTYKISDDVLRAIQCDVEVALFKSIKNYGIRADDFDVVAFEIEKGVDFEALSD